MSKTAPATETAAAINGQSVVAIGTFADSKQAEKHARDTRDGKTKRDDELRAKQAEHTAKAIDLIAAIGETTTQRQGAFAELAGFTPTMGNDARRAAIGYLASDEALASYDSRLATAKTVADHIRAGHGQYVGAKNYKALFARVKLEAATKAGIVCKQESAAAQSAVRLAQYAALCDAFHARDFASVAYLLRNRLCGWARFEPETGTYNVKAPVIGGSGDGAWRELTGADFEAVRTALYYAASAKHGENPDANFADELVAAGLLKESASSKAESAKQDQEADDAAIDVSVMNRDRLPIVDAFAKLNINNAALCLREWVLAHDLQSASLLAESLTSAIRDAFAPSADDADTDSPEETATDAEIVTDDESAILS